MKERAPKVSQGTPKVSQKGAQSEPKGAQSEPKDTKSEPKVNQIRHKMNINDKVAKKMRKRRLAHLFAGPFWEPFSIKNALERRKSKGIYAKVLPK